MAKSSGQADSSIRVSTHLGDFVGMQGSYGSRAWLGIPYGLPPTGPWRWKAPRHVLASSAPRSAVQAGPPSLQRRVSLTPDGRPIFEIVGSEDCLYLNVWAPPAGNPAVPLPVMVWIHGGGNLIGQGDSFDGGKLAATQNVIVVTINYRLGLFGWCTHSALRAEAADDRERSGNFAVLDMILALQWVRDSVSAFGGDPGNVTIFGESAGAWNVFALLASPPAAGLFHRAIVQSGGDVTVGPADGENFVDAPQPGEARSSGEILLRLLMQSGAGESRAEAKHGLAAMSDHEIATYLRAQSFEDLVRAYDAIAMAGSSRHSPAGFPHLFRDGAVLPVDGIRAAIEAGRYNRVPVILGSTRDEYRLMLPVSSLAFVRPLAGGMTFAIDDKQRYSLACEYLSRLWKADSVDEPAIALSRHQPGSVFAYRFDWAELKAAPWLDNIDLGACHGLDVPFVFGHLHLGPEFIQIALFAPENIESFTALSDIMMSYWAEFARTGDPNSGSRSNQVRWQPWGNGDGTPTCLLLASVKGGGPRMSSEMVTKDRLLSAFASDLRLADPGYRCRLLRDLVEIKLGWRFTAEDYRQFNGGECARSMPL
jgi:para-nitrobenzyl esterase